VQVVLVWRGHSCPRSGCATVFDGYVAGLATKAQSGSAKQKSRGEFRSGNLKNFALNIR